MGSEDHGAGAVEDAVVGVGRDVVQELVEVSLREFGGCCLGGSKLAEGDEELFFDCAKVI